MDESLYIVLLYCCYNTNCHLCKEKPGHQTKSLPKYAAAAALSSDWSMLSINCSGWSVLPETQQQQAKLRT